MSYSFAIRQHIVRARRIGGDLTAHLELDCSARLHLNVDLAAVKNGSAGVINIAERLKIGRRNRQHLRSSSATCQNQKNTPAITVRPCITRPKLIGMLLKSATLSDF